MEKKQKVKVVSTGVTEEVREQMRKRILGCAGGTTMSTYLRSLIMKDLKENGVASDESS